MESGGSMNGKKYCTRGLEGHTTLGSISKTKARMDAFAGVLEEQARQWKENEETDIQAISDIYRNTSSSSQLWAQVIGNQDQQAAESYQDKDDEEVEMTTTVLVKSVESAHKCPSQKRILKAESIIHQGARAA
jgi:hypothetical protein